MRGRSPLRNARSPWRSSSWTPSQLGLRALYDYRNSTSTTMVDQSGNGRPDATVAGGSNSPLWLPYTVPQVYFPGTAGNTVSCTAPSGTASYSAQPVGGGAPTTGVASAGDFAFGASNAGAWESVSLLNGSAVEVARFSASLSGQTGHTDAYSVAWTVNRSATGRKTVIQSPAAGSGRGVWLFGPDDYMTVANATAAVKGVDNAFTYLTVVRTWTGASDSWLGGDFANYAQGPGLRIERVSSGANHRAAIGDGTNIVSTGNVSTPVGVRHVLYAYGAAGSRVLGFGVDNGTPVASAALAGTATRDASVDLRIGGGNATSPGIFVDCEFEAFAIATRVLSAAEIARVVAFYGAGL